jgi:hypothetical protein
MSATNKESGGSLCLRSGGFLPWLVLGFAFELWASPVAAQARAKKTAEPEPDPMAEIQTLKADFERRLLDQEEAAKRREEAIRKEAAAAVEAARDEADQRMAADRTERQAEILRLEKAWEETGRREDERERNAPPAVGASGKGVSFYGYVQGDYQVRQSSEDQLDASGQSLNQDRFLIRRARLGVVMDRRYGEGRMEIDGNTVNGPAFRLYLAEASLKWPGSQAGAPPIIMGTLGLFRTPFGREVPQDDRHRLFMERTTAARALFPGEADIGARLYGGWQFLRYALAVQNGQPLGSSSFAGLDPNHQKDLVGRVGVEHSLERFDFAGGFSGLFGRGFHAGMLASKPTVQWNDADENNQPTSTEITATPGVAASASSSFNRLALGADLAIAARFNANLRTSVAAELYLASALDRASYPADPKSVLGRDFRELGYYVSLIQEYGPWRLGVRYDFYNPDQDSSSSARGTPVPTNVSFSTVAIVAGCATSWGRLLAEYDRNRNHLGLDLRGMPANLADDAIMVRGEVSF